MTKGKEMVKAMDGKLINRLKAVFLLRKDPKDSSRELACDRAYKRLSSRQLIVEGKQKLNKAEKKALKRARRIV